ncbi:unnamed protein product [Calicophoron daubneyi]|uniref:Solute carrier family 43 member 3 n=1 Tax=Calicophoron daubneyi TaxID=300641 RepID=A0AAV2U1F5_CALDB
MGICKRLDFCFTGRARRWVTVVIAIIDTLWFTGIHYGFNSLTSAYSSLGVFASYCNGDNCDGQTKMFSYVFMVANLVQLVLVPLCGLLLDKGGLRVAKLVNICLTFAGALMFGFADGSTSYILFPAMILVSVSGNIGLMCNQQASSLFPRYRGLIVSLISGAFDSSTVVDFIASRTFPRISLKVTFVILACCALVCGLFVALFLLTQYSSGMAKLAADQDVLEGDGLDEDATENTSVEQVKKEVMDEVRSGLGLESVDQKVQEIIVSRYPTLKSCFRSYPFLLGTLWYTFGQVRFSYFLAQLSKLLNDSFPGNSSLVNKLLEDSTIFTICGIVMGVIGGAILDACRNAERRRLASLISSSGKQTSDDQIYWIYLRALAPPVTLMACCSLILSCILFVRGQQAVFYVAFFFLLVFRSLLTSTLMTLAISSFPTQSFGIVVGVMCVIAGAVSTVQYGLLELSITTSHIICVVISALTFIPPIILFVKSGQSNKRGYSKDEI